MVLTNFKILKIIMDEDRETEANAYDENNLQIHLPQAFRDLKVAKRMAIDIGKHILYKF